MQEHPMSRPRQYHKRQAKAIQRRRHTAAERLQRDRRQAQHAAEALQQALDALELPKDLVTEIEHIPTKLLTPSRRTPSDQAVSSSSAVYDGLLYCPSLR